MALSRAKTFARPMKAPALQATTIKEFLLGTLGINELELELILTSSRPWCPGPEKCLYKRSPLSLPSKAGRKKLGR